MNRRARIILVTILLCSLLLAGIAFAASASTTGSYGLFWWTVDSGGGLSTSGDYALGGTIGQPDAGVMSGGDYVLGGGFWGGGLAAAHHFAYLPLIRR